MRVIKSSPHFSGLSPFNQTTMKEQTKPKAPAETKGKVAQTEAEAKRIAAKYPSLMVIHVKETAKKVGN